MDKISFLRGKNITATTPNIKSGQLLFDTTSHALWIDTSPTTRIKLYDSLDTVSEEVSAIKDSLSGILGSGNDVLGTISNMISELRTEYISPVEIDTIGI